MLQSDFAAVPAQALTADGGADGSISIADTSLFKVEQVVILASTGQSNLELEVKRVVSSTSLVVGEVGGIPSDVADVSAYLVTDSASISANQQLRPVIGADTFERAVYAEEPVVAKRVILVDKMGNPYTASGGGGGGGTVDQGTPTTASSAWPVKVTDGTDILAVNSDGSVNISDGGGSLTVDGTVAVSNFPATQPVSGTVAVSNFPATQPISAVALPLPSNAAIEAGGNLAAIATHQTDGTQQTQVTNFPSSQAVTGPLTDAQLRATAVPVSGPLTDAQLRATAVPVSATSLPLPTGAATEATQLTAVANLQTLNSLTPSVYDYISLSYTGANLTTVVYKLGGSGGTTVSTLTLGYTGANLTSVTKS